MRISSQKIETPFFGNDKIKPKMTQRLSRIHTIQEICRIYHQMYDFSNSSTTEPESSHDSSITEETPPQASQAPPSFWGWIMTQVRYLTS